ncbi:MAG: aminotransferase class V-fold PLP-dependent enzyme [Planctomycetota bacterium]
MRPRTRIARIDATSDPHRATAVPIYQTATFAQDSPTEFSQYDYSRSGNPTRHAVEHHLCRLEGGVRALAYGSGIAAVAAVTRLLLPGDELLAHDDVYGGSWRLFEKVLEPRGIRVRFADLTDAATAAAAITADTRLVFCESLSNPLLRACDLRLLAQLAHARGARLCVDATAVSPYLQQPLQLGADFVVHSATKYLGGHGDLTAGVVAVRSEATAAELAFLQNAEGTALAPFDSFLLLRGVQTLSLRLDRQQQNAQRIAEWLTQHRAVSRVLFPGLAGHETARVHAAQATGTGAVISFATGDENVSRRLVSALRLFRIAVSFGGVQSSVSLPVCMSHRSVPSAVRAARDLGPDLVRLSIGIEDWRDLIDDLDQALLTATRSGDTARSAEPAPRAVATHDGGRDDTAD